MEVNCYNGLTKIVTFEHFLFFLPFDINFNGFCIAVTINLELKKK